jgi:hypothetical protein
VKVCVVAEFYPRAADPVLGVWAHRQAVAARDAGADVRAGRVTVRRHRLYSLVRLPAAGRHVLSLDAAPGVVGYAFTFG